jgi:hypothetical protein
MNVLDSSHSEVVRLAHVGPDILTIEVVCTSTHFRKSTSKSKNNNQNIPASSVSSTSSSTASQSSVSRSKPDDLHHDHSIIMNGHLLRLTNARKTSDHSIPGEKNGQSKTVEKVWKRRWFVLKSDYCLYWFKTPKVIFLWMDKFIEN